MARVLMKGNEAFGEGAIQAGCRHFFGYPITPQSELPHFLARRLPEIGGVYLQAESEVAAINMVYGAAAAGARALTSSSGPGISLMQEGISYIAGAELPCVIINVMRGGPGLGNIAPSQGDYFQATRGGGHGDYRTIVLAPATVQEIIKLMQDAFEMADRYRNPVMLVGDGVLGQMMEPVELSETSPVSLPAKPWATVGRGERKENNIINSLYIVPEVNEEKNRLLADKYAEITMREQRWEAYCMDGAETVLVAFGTVARVAKAVVDRARADGAAVGLIRPITLWPFPEKAFIQAQQAKRFLVVEMNLGQMVEDVRLCVNGRCPVHFHGRPGGTVPAVREVYVLLQRLTGVSQDGHDDH